MTDPSSAHQRSHVHLLPDGQEFASAWWVALISGLLNLVAGLVVLVEPHTSLLAIALVLGIYLVIVGIATAAVGAFKHPLSWLLVAVGVAAVIAGAVVMARPGSAIRGVMVAFAIYLVLAGCLRIVAALAVSEGRGGEMLRGILDVAAGAVFLAAPKLGLAALALFVGLYLLVRAVIELLLAWSLHSLKSPAG